MAQTKLQPNDLIVRTKLNPPPRPQDFVSRVRLDELLQTEPNRSLTLVSAPAGYGKSTLISSWLEQHSMTSVWLSLDDEDNDLRVFLHYFVEAVRMHSPKALRDVHDYLEASDIPPSNIVAKALSNGLQQIKRPFILVIDDYHRIRESAIHELLIQLLRFPSRSFQLTLITRHDPPLSLAALRAQGRLLEIREQDLRFTQDETRTVVKHMAALTLSDQNLSDIESRLEGWIVGLRLACIALRNKKDPEEFLTGMLRGTPDIQEYLTEEVLKRLPPELQHCLLKTSILNRFCTPLCEALCEKEPERYRGDEFIHQLEQANLFSIPLDSRGEWFRYHHLFQDLLQRKLKAELSKTEIAELHDQASAWFEKEGLIDEALQHALHAGNNEQAARLIADNRIKMLNLDRWYVLEKWVDLLPLEIRSKHPGVLLAEAWSAYERFHFDRLAGIIAQIEPLLKNDTDAALSGEWCLLRGEVHYWSGEGAISREYFETAREQLPEQEGLIQGLLELQYSLALSMEGQSDQGVALLDQRFKASRTHEGVYLSRLVAGLFFVHYMAGNLFRARTGARRMHAVATKSGIAYSDAWSFYMEACSYLQANELEEAERLFNAAVGQRYILHKRGAIDALAGLALTQQMRGKESASMRTMDLLQAYALDLNDAQYLSVAESSRARLALLRGELSPAMIWARSANEVPVSSGLFMWLEVPALTQARVLIADGTSTSLDRAVTLLAEVLSVSEPCHFNNQTIEAMVLQVLAQQARNHHEEAQRLLFEALELTESGGWIRPFVEAGAPMVKLLSDLPKNACNNGFMESLITAMAEKELTGSPRPEKDVNQSLIEPLTHREQDVLELLAERMYDKEIADSLMISVDTVKTHLKHIYGKLQVPNRREAASKAKALGLLD